MTAIDAGTEYRVPDGSTADTVVASIGGSRRVAEEPAGERILTFYDTFDWALYLDGGALLREESEESDLIWQALDGSERLVQPCPEAPGFAADLPPGPVRARILSPGGIRRLLPRMGLSTRARTLRLLDEEDKTVVRIALHLHRFHDPELGREGALPARLRILPVRGYDGEREEVESLLADLELVPTDTPLLLEALDAAGRRPADYSTKLDYRLDPHERADAATRRILLGLLDTLERNVAGARANLDSEFLHDLRVAVRRTRSALAQLRGVFPRGEVERWKERFAWLQQVTGPVRDLDVWLLGFEDYREGLPPDIGLRLDPLRDYILAHYDEEQSRLAAALGSAQMRGLLRDWRTFLESPLPAAPLAKDALSPIAKVADARIRRMAKRVRQEGRAIRADSPAEDLHELRKSCKKLRYLMEFLQSLYPESEIRDLVKLMKVLLDNLGTHQDLSVQAEHLRVLARRMRDEDRADTDTLLAMGALIGDLLHRRQQARDAFADVFAAFLADENRQRLKRLFEPDQPESEEEADLDPPDARAKREGQAQGHDL